MTSSLSFDVWGIPGQQGSKNARHNPKTGKTAIYEQSSVRQSQWRRDVISAAGQARHAQGWLTVEGAVRVAVTFRVVRPPSVSLTRRPYPHVKPDLDKYVRNTLDGLKEAGVYKDDGQVVELWASKRYATDDPSGAPGAYVQVEVVKPPEII